MTESDPVALKEIDDKLRTLVFQRFIADGRAPTTQALVQGLGVRLAETVASLRRIEHPADVLLAPGSNELWIARPFSSPGSGYRVTCGGQEYWAACAQDALWTSLVLNADVCIDAACGDCGEPLHIEVQNGRAVGDAVIHCIVPPSHFFDNVALSCGATLFFRSEAHARRWCALHGLAFGAVASLNQMLDLSRPGRQTHLHASHRLVIEPLDKHIARFVDAGLTGEFWLTRRQERHDPESAHESIADQSAVRGSAGLVRSQLTVRESEVLHLLSDGSSLKQAAHRLGISPYTVDTHVRNLYSKLGVRSRAAAIAIALRARLI